MYMCVHVCVYSMHIHTNIPRNEAYLAHESGAYSVQTAQHQYPGENPLVRSQPEVKGEPPIDSKSNRKEELGERLNLLFYNTQFQKKKVIRSYINLFVGC